MSTTTDPTGAGGAVIVSVILDDEHGRALDAACGAMLSSRAGLMRRATVALLREEGFLAPLAPRTGQPRRARAGGQA